MTRRRVLLLKNGLLTVAAGLAVALWALWPQAPELPDLLRIQSGMTRAEVAQVIGRDGVSIENCAVWLTDDGGEITVYFDYDGRVAAKGYRPPPTVLGRICERLGL